MLTNHLVKELLIEQVVTIGLWILLGSSSMGRDFTGVHGYGIDLNRRGVCGYVTYIIQCKIQRFYSISVSKLQECLLLYSWHLSEESRPELHLD
jgi:hypothetical protein